ncbi:MAG: response regulator transcription factor, partial [Bauldia litoralis]
MLRPFPSSPYTGAMRVLVIEDDPETASYVANGLREAGHMVEVAETGRLGLIKAVSDEYDVAVVDRMLPEVDGKTIVESIRASGRSVPILFLSAMAEVRHRVEGLRAGADDYLTKPFAFSELLARVEALGRRGGDLHSETTLKVSDLEMDLLARTVSRGGESVELLPREFKLLEYLMRHAGQVVTRTMLLENVWDYHFDPQTNVIDVHISRLRQKIDRGFDRPLLQTVRGAGYMLR